MTRLARVTHVALVVLAVTSRAYGQTSADGVAAFVRGDYAAAAQILQPIAEAWPPTSDQAATFFMGVMYDNGLGVAADRTKACAHYRLASLRANGTILGRMAQDLDVEFRGSSSVQAQMECASLVNYGFHSTFEKRTFTLGPQHSVSFDVTGAIVSFNGETKQQGHTFALPGIRMVSLEHTALGGSPTPRHFIEGFSWLPTVVQQPPADPRGGQPGRMWALTWTVYEVVRTSLASAFHATVMTVAADEPPATSTINLASLARLRVNADGDVEALVPDSTEAQVTVIPSEAQRLETARLAREKVEAMSRIDWERRLDLRRTPRLVYTDVDGCARRGVVTVFSGSASHDEAILVWLDASAFQSDGSPQTFDVNSGTVRRLDVQVFQTPRYRWPFCHDVGYLGDDDKVIWKAVSGLVTVRASPVPEQLANQPRRVTVTIVDAEFMSPNGTRVRQSAPIVLTTTLDRI